jgi:hypothetical protein
MTPTAIGLTNSAVAGAFERHAFLATKGDHLKNRISKLLDYFPFCQFFF